MTRSLRELLSTWENWSARRTLYTALRRATTDSQRQQLLDRLKRTPQVDALDALADASELVSMLTGWRWQAMYAARCEGASWEQIATVLKCPVDEVRAEYTKVIGRQDRLLQRDVSAYHAVQ